jgi:hypothetical protein
MHEMHSRPLAGGHDPVMGRLFSVRAHSTCSASEKLHRAIKLSTWGVLCAVAIPCVAQT